MRKLTSYIWIALCSLLLIIFFILLFRFFFIAPKSIALLNTPTITYNGEHPGNNRQDSNVWIGCYNQQFYYFGAGKDGIDKTKYDDSLCVFQDDKLVDVAQLAPKNAVVTILGVVDHFLYYRVNDTGSYANQKLYCYDLKNGERTLVFSGHLTSSSSLYFSEDGSLYIPLFPQDNQDASFVHVSGTNLLGVKALSEGYILGDSTYFVTKEYSDTVEQILKTDQSGSATLEAISLAPAYSRSIIPYEGGLLVHNEEANSLLYRIDENGTVIELFNIEGMATDSAVNIHKTAAYISVKRYEKYGEKGMLRYENDTLEGTYKIDLIDGSVEKINDMCLDGIYNFDDTCFYCTDGNGNIYKMAFDGTLSPVLLLSEDK